MTESRVTRVLLVEDNLRDARLLREMLHESAPHATELMHVQSMVEAETHLASKRPAVATGSILIRPEVSCSSTVAAVSPRSLLRLPPNNALAWLEPRCRGW